MRKLYAYFLMILGIFGMTIIVSHAWFINSKEVDPTITGYSKSAYFESGNGSSESPYIISRSRHLYNLAWLQYLGEFNKEENEKVKQYYFKLSNNIDMTGISLPPIGTELYPFVGNFNGNNKVISNLTVYNKEEYFTYKPTLNQSNNDNFGNMVGMFGVIGSLDDSTIDYDKSVLEVKDFYLDNISVNSKTTKTLIGLLAGYANGNVSNVGIHYSNLSLISNQTYISTLNNNQAISNYGLIGYYNSNDVSWEDNPSVGTSFGTTIDIKDLFIRMKNIYNIGTTEAINKISSGNNSYGIKTQYHMPISSNSTNVVEETPLSDNTGYLTGEVKLYQLQDNAKKNDVFYKRTGGSGVDTALTNSDGSDFTDSQVASMNISGITTAKQFYDNYGRVPEKIKQNTIYADNVYGVRLTNSIDKNNAVSISNAKIAGNTYSSIIVPYNSVWFVPQQSGNVEIALYSNDDASAFTIFECIRQTVGDYTSAISSLNNVGDILLGNHTEMTKPKWYFYSFPVEAQKEYILTNYNSSKGAYLSYLDLGMSGSGQTLSSFIKNVDFVYELNGLYNEVNSDQSKVNFEIKGTSNNEFTIYFKRKYFSSIDILTLYYYDTTSTYSITKKGEGSASLGSDKDLNSRKI